MVEEHWDLPFFENKELPSSSDEDNPHLLSDDSYEEILFKKKLTDIIKDVGNELYNREKRKILHDAEEVEEEEEPEECFDSPTQESNVSISSKKGSSFKLVRSSRSDENKSPAGLQQAEERKNESKLGSTILLKEPEIEIHDDNSRIENFTYLALKKRYTTTIRKPKRKPVEVLHITPIRLNAEIQKELRCESGVDILLEQPWGLISLKNILEDLKKRENSPFAPYDAQLKAYPEEEVLIGRSDEANSDEFVIALTTHGREVLLEEIKQKHQSYIDAIIKTTDFPARPWTTLKSEEEISEGQITNRRPFISYDCLVKKEAHQQLIAKNFNYSEYYTEISDSPYQKIKMVNSQVMEKAIQASPSCRDILIQTTPEIPLNSTTQFSIEMRVKENEEILKNMELDEEYFSQKLTELHQMIEPHLKYNEDFDLYQDDYEILAGAGEEIIKCPTIPYEYLSTMFTFLGTEKKGVSSCSWHPFLTGVIAVAYASTNISMIGDLEGDSDEDGEVEESETDEKQLYAGIVTRSPFDNVLDKVWSGQIDQLKMQEGQPRNKVLYQLATTSLQFMKYARDMRLFQMVQARKQFLQLPDFDDLIKAEVFEYPLFEGARKKYKKKKKFNLDDVLERKSEFLDRDYLFSESFKWKMKGAEILSPIYMMMKEHKTLPKKYIKTFLFREIWSGDKWNFGADLELKAINLNSDFREAGILALGMPLIPKHKIFLPGFSEDESSDPASMVPWDTFCGDRSTHTGNNSINMSSSSDSDYEYNDGFFKEQPVCELKMMSLNLKRKMENTNEGTNNKELNELEPTLDNPAPKIIHVSDAYLSNTPWGFNPETQDFLLNEIKQIATCDSKQLFKNDIEVLSEGSDFDYWEKDEDIDDLDRLHLRNYVVIWTTEDILKPLRRLSCPFEVTAVSFCPFDAKFIAGGTATGQVVLWEVHDWSPHNIHNIKITNPVDERGFMHLRKVMSWFKRLTKIENIPSTSISTKKASHNDRVIDITWLPPHIKFTDEQVYVEMEEEGDSLQFMSTSADGSIFYWDLNAPAKPPLKASFSVHSLHRGKHFPVPEALKRPEPLYGDLYLRWEPIGKVHVKIPQTTVTALKYHLTCISHYELDYKYEVVEDFSQKNPKVFKFCREATPMTKAEALIGSVDGTVSYITWRLADEDGQVTKIPPEGIVCKSLRTFSYIHDGPIVRISRHPKNSQIFLTAGGHVFALWTIESEDPLKWKKYSENLTTFVGWTGFQGSSFRVGFSDGTFELWDLMEDGNNAKMRLPVGLGSLCDMMVPRLPYPPGLIGIIDQKGLLKFYNVPKEHQVINEKKDEQFFNKIEVEKKRKKVMSDVAEKTRKEILKAKELNVKEKTKAESDDEDESEMEVDEGKKEVKVKDVLGCKKYKEEMYKWYLRRRGHTSGWLDPAEKQWYKKEEEHMVQTILKNKNISMTTLEKALVPLKEKEKHETRLAVKKDEIVSMADSIFRKAVQELQLTSEEVSKSIFGIKEMSSDNIDEALKKVSVYFGEMYGQEEDTMETWVLSQKIDDKLTFGDILLRNQKVRDFWNDRRRYLDKNQRWLRELVKEELEKQGMKFTYWIDHEETYKIKKYRRRLEMLSRLKKIYGEDYDPFWDLDKNNMDTAKKAILPDKVITAKEIMEQLLNILVEIDPSITELKKKIKKASEIELHKIDVELLRKMVKYYINFVVEGGIRIKSNKHREFMELLNETITPKDEMKVQIDLPEGSFYRKYMKDKDKDKKWIKPKRTEEIFGTPVFKFKYGDSYPIAADEKLAEPKVLIEELIKPEKVKKPKTEEEEEEDELEEQDEVEEPKETGDKPDQKEESEIKEEDQPQEVEGRMSYTAKEIKSGEKEELDEGLEKEKSVTFEEAAKADQQVDKVGSSEEQAGKEDEKTTVGEEAEKEEIDKTFKDTDEAGEITEKDDYEPDLSEEKKRRLDVLTIYDIIEEKKAKGEEIMNIEDLSSYESIESLDSVSTLASTPDHSITSEEWEQERAEYLKETEKDLKEYFEGPPPRYEPPRRRPYFRAPHEDEPTEEWLTEEKNPAEEFGKSYLGIKTEKEDKPPE